MFDVHQLGSASVQAILTGDILYLQRTAGLLPAFCWGLWLFSLSDHRMTEALQLRSHWPWSRPCCSSARGGPSLLPGIRGELATCDPLVGFGSPSEGFPSETERVGFLRRLVSRNVKTFPVWKPVSECVGRRSSPQDLWKPLFSNEM